MEKYYLMVETSIVVIAYREEKYIKYLLESLLKQKYKDFEVIFVTPKNDPTRKVIEEFMEKNKDKIFFEWRILEDPGKGAGIARNIGLFNAKGEYTVFIDGDVSLSEDTIEKMIEDLKKHPNHGTNYPVMLISPKYDKDWLSIPTILLLNFLQLFLFSPLMKLGTLLGAKVGLTNLTACRTKEAKAIGGFRNFWPGEDLDFHYRLNSTFHKKHNIVLSARAWTSFRGFARFSGKAIKNELLLLITAPYVLLMYIIHIAYFLIKKKPMQWKYPHVR